MKEKTLAEKIKRKIGDIEFFKSWWGKYTNEVVWKINENVVESISFKSLENARIFSELLKLKEQIIKQKAGEFK